MTVTQVKGACTGADISGYIAACESAGSTTTTCTNWFNGAPTACTNCLAGPTTGTGDAAVYTGQGGLWLYPQGDILGANIPGCLALEGMGACASAEQNAIECIEAAGCDLCTDQASADACQGAVVATGGACSMYLAPWQTSCGPDFADGGLLNGGPCTTDTQVLSVICGNGSGDGG
jgi:hypothetical protein